MIVRILGLALVVAAAAVAGVDIMPHLLGQASGLRFETAGELWYRLDSASLNLAQTVVQRHVNPALWDPVILDVLLAPAWLALLVPGLLLLAFGPRRRRSASPEG